ncbi:hypothetical protein H310_00527 [Aphanomyces invadans]|uniref:RRM domain-containing protein n=1 Tax=Aphanomyces invadans TaxID=157072 RepID=A0A024UW44_9STRA|nr:hypothetical protein H310_00527 [Aphanomyces invadans]ETW10157.1 hypothetical protein H310_00527 [Aphanomyces invadans]|eukprot:XP_008861568.1 hypothetical protein H310_00527 [Aphanomyces invadans]
MFITVQEFAKERYVVEVPREATLESLLQAIAAVRPSINVADVKIEFPEGQPIPSGALLPAGVQEGSTVFLRGPSLGHQDDTDSVTADEIASTIIVTNIPVADKTSTEKAITDFFSKSGSIKRLILDGDNINQHAVIVFTTPEAATISLHHSGATLLNGTITVVAANSLSADAPHPSRSGAAVKSIAKVLASGISSAKDFDEQHKISLSVKSAAEVAKLKAKELDSQFKVSEKFSEVDEKFHVTEKATKATNFAIGTAGLAAKSAMANPVVSIGVKKLGSMFSSVMSVASHAVDEVKTQILVEDEKRLKSPTRQSGESSVFPSPASGVDGPAAAPAVVPPPLPTTVAAVAPPAPGGNYKDI